MKTPIKLPTFDRSALDYSILSTHQRCPRKALFRYWHGRAPLSINYPMEFGSAYHRYREILEKAYLAHFPEGLGMPDADQIKAWHMQGLDAALSGYPENPPPDHNKAFLTQIRLEENCEVGLDGSGSSPSNRQASLNCPTVSSTASRSTRSWSGTVPCGCVTTRPRLGRDGPTPTPSK